MCFDTVCDCRKERSKNKLSRDECAAQEFVDNLLKKGCQVLCDDSDSSFNSTDLPLYYDSDSFKRGQAFFNKHSFGVGIASFIGLLADLSIPTGLAVLMMTEMSSTNYTAYKRYLATLYHMLVWYSDDFYPGSDLWQSIKSVKSMHNAASKKASKVLNYRFNQRDMALAHWGFVGIVVSRPEFVGIYEENQESLRCFIHFWRVIGHLLGIKEEFNICKTTVSETKAICDEIALTVMVSTTSKQEPAFKQMCQYLVEGMWPYNPFLEFHSFMFYMEVILTNDRSSDSDKLKWHERLRVQILFLVFDWMKFSLVRKIMNCMNCSTQWLSRHFPLLAYWKYGIKNAHVRLFNR